MARRICGGPEDYNGRVSDRRLCFRFDFISPYSYLAWKEAPAFCEAQGLVLEAKPVLFAALLNHWGQLGPAEIEPKRRYTFKHCVRRAARAGVSFGLPPAHPFNPLTALRVVAGEADLEQRARVVDVLFDATWSAEATGIETPEKIVAALDAAGLEGEARVAATQAPEAKAAFRAENEAAIAAGVFGVPTLSIDDELYWGSDVFEDLADRLAGKDPTTEARWAGIVDLPSAAQRRR